MVSAETRGTRTTDAHGTRRAGTRRGRRFDIVVYGATGFVGRQVVDYLARSKAASGDTLRWAIAGRDAGKLAQVRRDAGRGAAGAGLLKAEADDAKALAALARSTRVVLNTAGPFARLGDTLVAACVAEGCHYVDITGETPWVRRLIDRHHAAAGAGGLRIIPCCGFDSVPSDLGTWMLVQAMRTRHGRDCSDVKAAFALRGGVNGGTLASALNLIETDQDRLLADPFLLNPSTARLHDARSHADPVMPYFDGDFQCWLGPFVMGPVNTRVVRRSAELLAYDRQFHYHEFLRVGGGLAGGAAALALSAGMAVSRKALKLAAVRRVARRLAPAPGQGPSEARMDGGAFWCELVGRSADGRRVRGRVRAKGDPGNRATTKMVCEAALALTGDAADLPGGQSHGGVLTPASGLGDVLVRRLRAAGMTLEVDDD